MSVDTPHFPEVVYCRTCNLRFGEHEQRVEGAKGVYLHERCYPIYLKDRGRLTLLRGGKFHTYVETE